MKLLFWRRRAFDDFAEAIRPELEAMTTPEPTTRLLDRILASRAAGVRIILPGPTSRPRVLATRAFASVAVAAAALLLVVPLVRRSRVNVEDIVGSSSFFAREALAQPIAHDGLTLPPLQLARPAAIRPMRLVFSRRNHDSAGHLTNEALDTLTVAAADTNGTRAWRVVTITRDIVAAVRRVQAETLYVARDNLRLLERTVHVSPYSRFARINVVQRFRGDSVTGRMTTDGPSIGAGRAIARRLRPELGPYLTDDFAPLALMAVPLSSTWQARASLLGWAVLPRDVFIPIEFHVDGEERVRVPAGTFDCWRLSIRFAGREVSYWARKEDGLGVRVLDRKDPARGRREIVLTRISE